MEPARRRTSDLWSFLSLEGMTLTLVLVLDRWPVGLGEELLFGMAAAAAEGAAAEAVAEAAAEGIVAVLTKVELKKVDN